jgi:hypothetical protein
MANTTNKLTALRDRQARIKAKIEQLENQNMKQARKDETRLKILVGAAVLADAARHTETGELLRAVLTRGITAPRDKEFLKARCLL